jgi:tripartite-type tricarboxylate transporter receptor subunit TctC
VVVENRTGAGATVGGVFVAQQPADGHTVLPGTISSVTARLHAEPAALRSRCGLPAAHPARHHADRPRHAPGFPAQTVQEWDRVVRQNPGGSASAPRRRQPAHLAGELYRSMTGADINHIAFRGSARRWSSIAPAADFIIVDCRRRSR